MGSIQGLSGNRGQPKDRGTMIDLSNQFFDAVIGSLSSLQDNSPPPAQEDSRFRIYVGNMHIGVMNGRHLFMRITDEERIICDFHGVCHVEEDGSKFLHVGLEPGDYDYFKHLKEDEYEHVWEGSAQELGAKLRRCIWAADMMNQNPVEYELLSENCNTILKTLLNVADIAAPENPAGWTPGYGESYEVIVAAAIQKADSDTIEPDVWLDRFVYMIEQQIEVFARHNLKGGTGSKFDFGCD